ncbi:MAG: zf-HC2 domain-containing protein [Lachnospiraceae bacterium]|nr:zf-HC2 domain-containing protein [Lachnospiraceae bacterium]
MKCNEARHMVVPFVKKELSERDMEAFLDHVESCEDCMDELDIYFVVYNALNAMDSGTHHEYDFKKMLAEEIRMSRRAILKRKISKAARAVLLILAELLLIFSAVTGVRMKQGLSGDSILERAILRMYVEERESELELLESELASETEAVTDQAETESYAVPSGKATETVAEKGEKDVGE